MNLIYKALAWLLSVSGLLVSGGQPQIRVVTAIEVEYQGQQCTVTDPELLHQLMNYLRHLDPYIPNPISPETFRADSTRLRVCYSDGTANSYVQLYTDYLQTDGGPWKKIDQADGARLYGILPCIFPGAVI